MSEYEDEDTARFIGGLMLGLLIGLVAGTLVHGAITSDRVKVLTSDGSKYCTYQSRLYKVVPAQLEPEEVTNEPAYKTRSH